MASLAAQRALAQVIAIGAISIGVLYEGRDVHEINLNVMYTDPSLSGLWSHDLVGERRMRRAAGWMSRKAARSGGPAIARFADRKPLRPAVYPATGRPTGFLNRSRSDPPAAQAICRTVCAAASLSPARDRSAMQRPATDGSLFSGNAGQRDEKHLADAPPTTLPESIVSAAPVVISSLHIRRTSERPLAEPGGRQSKIAGQELGDRSIAGDAFHAGATDALGVIEATAGLAPGRAIVITG